MKRRLAVKMVSEGQRLKVALEAVDLASSSYHYHSAGKRRPRALDGPLVAAIHTVRKGHAEVYGYRKVTLALKATGLTVNAKKVLRHLRVMGLIQPRKRKGNRWTRPVLVKPEERNRYWEADFTCVGTGRANAWLCAVIDARDRDVIGDVFSDRCRALEAGQALERAALSRFGGRAPEGHELTMRVDRGPQFTSRSFRETARALNVRLEYAGIQCPEDKPYIESFFSSYKTEELYRNEYDGLMEAKNAWEAWRDWYREIRLHQNLGYLSPRQYTERMEKCILLVA